VIVRAVDEELFFLWHQKNAPENESSGGFEHLDVFLEVRSAGVLLVA
jgi:hypothetical protein